MHFDFKPLDIKDVVHIKPKKFDDQRGFFSEVFKASEFEERGITGPIVQVNHSRSHKNVLRGLHYQLNPKAQGKMVGVVLGEIYDVGVDLRKESSTYGNWVGAKLTSENKGVLYFPEGFAHGFCVLSDVAEVVYYCTGSEYSPENEHGIIWNDPSLKIEWPIQNPILSEKDSQLSRWDVAENNF